MYKFIPMIGSFILTFYPVSVPAHTLPTPAVPPVADQPILTNTYSQQVIGGAFQQLNLSDMQKTQTEQILSKGRQETSPTAQML